MAKSIVDPEAAVQRWLAGETYNQIGRSFGVSRQRIHQIVQSRIGSWHERNSSPVLPKRRRQKRKTMEDRFWEKVKTAGACWLWQGSLSGSLGYGQFRVDSETVDFAHRVSWRMAHGPIPDELLVLHRCDVPRCVRPEHLYLGTSADNMADKSESMRIRRASNNRQRVGPIVFSLRMQPELLKRIDEIAFAEKLSRSEVIRLAVRNYYARLFNKAA